MSKLLLPIIGILINIILYCTLPYDGEFGLLIIIGLIISSVLGFFFGVIIDKIQYNRTKILILIFSILVITGFNWWIFPLKY